MKQKILEFETCREVLDKVRQRGKRIVHCHGTFELLHPGHIQHLEEAAKMGDVLVVTVTAAQHVHKGPGRPIFNDEQRLYCLASLQMVDYVVLVRHPGAVEIVEKVRPHIYCKGVEYADPKNFVDQRIAEDAQAVRRFGGQVRFVGQPVFSSSKLVGSFFSTVDPEIRDYIRELPHAKPDVVVDDVMEKIAGLRVLVVGDFIVDRYTYCKVQGLTAKARILSVRPRYQENYLGGAYAIARHIRSFVKEAALVTLSGGEPWVRSLVRSDRSNLDTAMVLMDSSYHTIVKERYVEQPGNRSELIKIFATNRLLDAPSPSLRQRLIRTLKKALPRYDMVILGDYGHGMVDPEIQHLLERKSPWLALNCQTNSYNHGYNLITKYRRCHMLALDENELRLAFGDRNTAHDRLLVRLCKQVGCRSAHLTMSSQGSLSWLRPGAMHCCPAMTRSALDTIGAGDAYYAIAALCSHVQASQPISSFLGNIAGGLAANIVGNKEAIDKRSLVKNAVFMLKSYHPEVGN